MRNSATLVGDGIENPGNALTMIHAAEMYNSKCYFHDTASLADTKEFLEEPNCFSVMDRNDFIGSASRIIAFDNQPGARDVYGFSGGRNPTILVGNERRGLSRTFKNLATDAVEIPMHSRRINCLNVAAASAVALHYLTRTKTSAMVQRNNVANHRPELLLMGMGNHIELGSAIRSATAFGWERAFLEDREQVWFGCNRIIRSEGRGAARRGRNKIRLVPCPSDGELHFPEIVVVTTQANKKPLHKTKLARGPKQLIVIPDETQVDLAEETWERLGQNIQFVSLDVPARTFPYHYRLVATVAMAEIARQVGRRPPGIPKPKRKYPVYDRVLQVALDLEGEDVWLEELMDY